ncbi:MAG: hypothetical protein ABDI20_07450 [Candidatus Bipolaricaulaceae bacterium]
MRQELARLSAEAPDRARQRLLAIVRTRSPDAVGRPLCTALHREWRRRRVTQAEFEALRSFLERNLASYCQRLRTIEAAHVRYQTAASLMRNAFDEAEVSAGYQMAGLRRQIEFLTWQLESAQTRQSGLDFPEMLKIAVEITVKWWRGGSLVWEGPPCGEGSKALSQLPEGYLEGLLQAYGVRDLNELIRQLELPELPIDDRLKFVHWLVSQYPLQWSVRLRDPVKRVLTLWEFRRHLGMS